MKNKIKKNISVAHKIQKQVVQQSSQEQKTWKFDKGIPGTEAYVKFDFTLRVDSTNQLTDFLEILDRARESVAEEIEKRKR